MTFFLLLLGSLLTLSTASDAQETPSLQKLLAAKKGQRRVVLVYARTTDQADLLAQQRLLTDARTGLDERDFDVVTVRENELSPADRQYLHSGDRRLAPSADFSVWLIGKDGGVKERYTAPVSAPVLFRTVDAMPMRQREMKRRP